MEDADSLASLLGCKLGSLLSSYLGLPLAAKYKSKVVWDGVEERFQKSWLYEREITFLRVGGREGFTLIRSTLSNLPIYLMSLFRMPKMEGARLDKLQGDFLWGGGDLAK